jgi:hypothetical protein
VLLLVLVRLLVRLLGFVVMLGLKFPEMLELLLVVT